MTLKPFSPLPRRLSLASGAKDRLHTLQGSPKPLRLARGRHVGYAVVGVSRDALIRLIDFPELPLRIHTRDTIKAGRSALLVRGEIPMGGRMIPVAYKRVQRRSRWKVLTAWLFGNRTLRTFRMALTLERLGIPTAAPLLVVVPRWYQPAGPSYLACEWLTQGLNLTRYADWLSTLSLIESRQRLHCAAKAVGELIGRMHAQRVSHRDLKAGNVILINKPSSVEAYVIDLDGAHRAVWLPMFRRRRDLSRLVFATQSYTSLTHSTRLRCLKSYLRAAGEPMSEWKSVWRQLVQLTRRKQWKKTKHG